MRINMIIKKYLASLSIALLLSTAANATIVRVETNVGVLDINLYDETTPLTVANFLEYVESGRYDNTIIHRSIEGFVIQGGGFSFDGLNSALEPTFANVEAEPAVINEPEHSNVRGTIAMAKLGGDPNSATSQWFINLGDNSSNLDRQNGGFTVFGEVIDVSLDENGNVFSGISTLDLIANTRVYNKANFHPALGALPLRNVADANEAFDETNLINVLSVVVTNDAMDTASNLEPVLNTLINDLDNDGVLNDSDQCAGTIDGLIIDEDGCALNQLDTDKDGISDAVDECPETVEGTSVTSNGCEKKKSSGGAGTGWLLPLVVLMLIRKKCSPRKS